MYHFITDLSSDDFLEEESTIKVINTVSGTMLKQQMCNYAYNLDSYTAFSIIFKK